MNTMFKQISKLLTFLLIIAMSSCQKDELNESITETKNTNLVKEFTFVQATQKTEFNNAYNKVSYGLHKINKNGRDSDSNFIIDSTTVKQITINGKTTYTIAIRRATPTPTYFENLIVQVSNIDSTRAFISKFTPAQKMVFNENHNTTSFQGTSEIKEIHYNGSIFSARIGNICITQMMCSYGGTEHPAGEKCGSSYPKTTCVEITGGSGQSGSGSGAGAGGYSGTGGTSGSSTSGSGSNGGSDSGQVYTAPVIPTYTSINLTTALSLSPAKQTWISNNGTVKKQLQQFLFNYPFSTSNFTFALNAVNFYMQNTSSTINQEFISEIMLAIDSNPQAVYDINNFPGKTDNMPFEWWKDNSYIQQNLKMVTDSNINSAPPQPNEREVLLFSQFPLHALVHVKNSNIALNKSKSLVTNGTFTRIHNGKADAFRHAFWNAYDTVQIGATITKLFTDAHEWNSGNNALESQMDFYNNQEGINLGNTLSLFSTESLVESTIITAIYDGSLQYLYPLQNHDGDNIIVGTTIKKFTNN